MRVVYYCNIYLGQNRKKNKQLLANKNLQSNHWKAISKITTFKSLHAHFPEIRGCLKNFWNTIYVFFFAFHFVQKMKKKSRYITFCYSKNIANFEVFCEVIIWSDIILLNLLFLEIVLRDQEILLFFQISPLKHVFPPLILQVFCQGI